MPAPNNILQQVITYQKSALAYLQNLSCFIHTANKKFENFENLIANLGQTVSFTKPTRFTSADSLVATFQTVEQRVQTLTVDQAKNVSYDFTAQQFIFNADEFMEEFGKGATEELAAAVEINVAKNCETAPFRFYGDGVTQINTYGQLASALTFFRNFGAARGETKGYLADIAVPAIIESGLQQFALKRNDENAMSWELGPFSRCEWYQSNLLPTHIAGTEGVTGTTLTVVSTTTNSDGAVTAITFSGTHAANDANSVLQYDKFQFVDGVAGQPNMRFLTFIGHNPCNAPVQFSATAQAASTGGSQVTVSVYPPLQAPAGRNQNLNNAIVAGMQVTVLPTHRTGMITSGDPLYLAMPRLPDEHPFDTANATDSETGVSMRMYHGSIFGQNQRGTVHDCIWGSTTVQEYCMGLIFPE